jgi:hypothetical protein
MMNEIKNTGVRRLSYSKAFDFVCSARPFTPFYCEVAYSVLRAKLFFWLRHTAKEVRCFVLVRGLIMLYYCEVCN